MRMKRKVLSPGMENSDHAGFGTQMLMIMRKTLHYTPGCIEEDLVDLRRFKQAQLIECFWQCEDYMEISCWKQLGFSCLDPTLALYLLTLGTMTIPAGVVADASMTTTCA